MTTTQPLYQRLAQRHRLKKSPPLDDLPALSTAYAKKAAYHGPKGPWWRVWRAIERARGHRLRTAIAGLKNDDRRWFALWSFARKRLREGIVVYRAYLAAPRDVGPLDKESAEYLRHVITVRGAGAALAAAEHIPAGTLVAGVVTALLAEHRPAELLARTPEPSGANIHDGPAWARRAIALAKNGDAADAALERAAKLGVHRAGPELDGLLQATFPTWAERETEWGYPAGDPNDRWRARPGARVAPPDGESLHAFGGADFALPTCKGCGHAEHQFFVFDVAAIPDLQMCIPAWPKLPIIGCVDCVTWLTRRDYRIDHAKRRIENIGVGAEGENLAGLGKAYGTLAPLVRRQVAVVPVGADEIPGTDRTQIGGEPDWVQDVARVFCPRCWNELVFVAAHGSTSEPWLDADFTVNNGSGNQYYFACSDCGVLSVFGQNT